MLGFLRLPNELVKFPEIIKRKEKSLKNKPMYELAIRIASRLVHFISALAVSKSEGASFAPN